MMSKKSLVASWSPAAHAGSRTGRPSRALQVLHRVFKAPWPALVTVAALVATFLVANREIAAGRAAPRWDAVDFVCSALIMVADHARVGRVMLWNPWSNAGAPDCCTGAVSPICVFYGYLAGGSLGAFRWYWLLSWLAGGLGMLVLTRHLRTPLWGALIVALGFSFSGLFTGHAEHTPIVHAFAALPWIVWRWDVALRYARLRPAVEAGALWGLSALAGYPAIVLINAGVAFLWLLGWLLFLEPDSPPLGKEPSPDTAGADRRHPWHGIPALLALGLVGTVIMSPLYLTLLIDCKGYSDRSSSLPRDAAIAANALHPNAAATLFSPYLPMTKLLSMTKLFGTQYDAFPGTDVSSISMYTGAILLWLALAAPLMRPGSGWRWWLMALAVFAFAVAIGPALPIRGWLYDYVPPTRYFHHSSLFRGYTLFAIAILAGMACRDLDGMLRRPTDGVAPGRDGLRRMQMTLALTGMGTVAAAVLAYGLLIGRWAATAAPDQGLSHIHFCTCWGGILVLTALMVLRPRAMGRPVLPAVLVALTLTDTLLNAYLSRHTIYTPDEITRANWERLNREHDESLDLTTRGLERLPTINRVDNQNLVTKVPVIQDRWPLGNRFHLAWCGKPRLVGMVTGPDRIWFAPATGVEDTHLTDATFDAFCRRSAELGVMPVVIHRTEAMLQPTPSGTSGPDEDREVGRILQLPAAARIPVELRSYRPNSLTFRVSVPGSGYLLITDRWARAWRALVDGQPAPVLGGNFIFRALALKPGTHTVVLRYEPAWYPYLLFVSWGTLAVVAGWSLVAAISMASRAGWPQGIAPRRRHPSPKFSFRRFGGGSRAARRVKFPPANRS